MPGKHLSTHKRGQWGRQIEFVLTLIGYAVGLGNVWRFPYLCFKNGGGAFLIPYTLSLIFLGIPLFALEVAFGQFGGRGPLTIWFVSPAFRGVGIAALLVSTVIQLYYAVVIAWGVFYLFASMDSVLPWTRCDDCSCLLFRNNDSMEVVLNRSSVNCSGYDGPVRPSSEIYFREYALDSSGNIDRPGNLNWKMMLCNLFGWVIVFLVLCRGIKSLGKVVYFTTTVPYIIMTILLIRGVTLDGALTGILFYLTPDFSRLSDASVWSDAAVQIFFSLSACQGGLIAMSSYNRFDNNILREAFLVPIINCLTSFFAGFIVFSVLGHIAVQERTTVANVTQGGPGLAFVVYPDALATMPAAPLWAILFFFLFCILGFSSQFSLVETVITSVFDEFPHLFQKRWPKYAFRALWCFVGFLLGFPFLTQGGAYLLDLIDNSILGYPSLVVGLCELLILGYIYGYKQISVDIYSMTDIRPIIFSPCWLVISPVLLLLIIIATAAQHQSRLSLGDPVWAEVLHLLVSLVPICCIPAWFFYYTCPRGLWATLRHLTAPKPEWIQRRFSIRKKAARKHAMAWHATPHLQDPEKYPGQDGVGHVQDPEKYPGQDGVGHVQDPELDGMQHELSPQSASHQNNSSVK
ncbi:sodium- and chloride-dependent glycine transporter 1-like isoform X2 [Pomacea canaliculata]|uniref:sodium- and chloride-dependent glycine transporter 1-like isoform X2 n=1 Tax=Pomacea canaliculata TaxID=400727 RepID=UPI000D734B81|nr:sodium- and chloride-dependent glycine transporter 1-like isoform X2 [Pomacea canaliculata]